MMWQMKSFSLFYDVANERIRARVELARQAQESLWACRICVVIDLPTMHDTISERHFMLLWHR